MPQESKLQKKERSVRIIETLKKAQPAARCTLNYDSEWQLLFAAILASQCTDERVNIITASMFKKLPNLHDYTNISQTDLEKHIRSCGLYRSKAKNIIGSATLLWDKYGGQLPSSKNALLEFPGVGEKIAHLLLGEIFAKPAIVVDTHCARITRLLQLSGGKSASAVEQDLREILPAEYWIAWGHHMVELGRTYCKARCKQCASCPIAQACPHAAQAAEDIARHRQEGRWHECY